MRLLCAAPKRHMAPLRAAALLSHTGAKGAPRMADILVIILGTGAILLMAAYAVLCERI